MKGALISISGLDGAGKTTIINELERLASISNVPVKRVWCSYELILLRPIIRIFQLIFFRKKDQFKNYSDYYESINTLSKKGVLAKPYEVLTLLEYRIQLFYKIKLPLFLGRNIICDRYYYDVLVSLAITLSYTDDKLDEQVAKFSKYCPNPDQVYYIDVPEEIAFNRKNDIPSIEYLRQRRRMYLRIAEQNNITILDGQKEPLENVRIILSKFPIGVKAL